MDPRLSYITPFFFMAFGIGCYIMGKKVWEQIKKRKEQKE